MAVFLLLGGAFVLASAATAGAAPPSPAPCEVQTQDAAHLVLGIAELTREHDGTSDAFGLFKDLKALPLQLQGLPLSVRLVETPLDAPFAVTGVVSGALQYRREPVSFLETTGAVLLWITAPIAGLVAVASFGEPESTTLTISSLFIALAAGFGAGWLTYDLATTPTHVYASRSRADLTLWRQGAEWKKLEVIEADEVRTIDFDDGASRAADARLRQAIRTRLQAELEAR